MSPKIVTNSILIRSTLQHVWDVLTKPEFTKIYMFGCETVSDWKEGSPLLWNGQYEGKEVTFVSGHILELKPPHRLIYSVIDLNAPYEKTPENHLKVLYELAETADGVEFKVSQYGFEEAADGEKRFTEIYNNGDGWQPILVGIKELIENQGN
jgi:uncharacterized protein YndB with AHSA1/START domain